MNYYLPPYECPFSFIPPPPLFFLGTLVYKTFCNISPNLKTNYCFKGYLSLDSYSIENIDWKISIKQNNNKSLSYKYTYLFIKDVFYTIGGFHVCICNHIKNTLAIPKCI